MFYIQRNSCVVIHIYSIIEMAGNIKYYVVLEVLAICIY